MSDGFRESVVHGAGVFMQLFSMFSSFEMREWFNLKPTISFLIITPSRERVIFFYTSSSTELGYDMVPRLRELPPSQAALFTQPRGNFLAHLCM